MYSFINSVAIFMVELSQKWSEQRVKKCAIIVNKSIAHDTIWNADWNFDIKSLLVYRVIDGTPIAVGDTADRVWGSMPTRINHTWVDNSLRLADAARRLDKQSTPLSNHMHTYSHIHTTIYKFDNYCYLTCMNLYMNCMFRMIASCSFVQIELSKYIWTNNETLRNMR